MKKLLIFSTLALISSCQPDNPQPNTTNNGSGSGNTSDTTSTGGGTGNPYHYTHYCTDSSNWMGWNEDINYGSVTDIDGNEYRTVVIGNQEWMAENLKTTHYSNGDEIIYNSESGLWDYSMSGYYAWCIVSDSWYEDSIQYVVETDYKNCTGCFYNWFAAVNPNLCPTGWHVPSDDEWTVLENYIEANGYEYVSAVALRVPEFSYNSPSHYITGTDIYGFRVIPAGREDPFGDFGSGRYARFWTSSSYSDNHVEAWLRGFDKNVNYIIRSTYSKHLDYSIRCIKD